MGAITFCPHPPFHIHSVSSMPILQEHLYQGAWYTKGIDYVVNPYGLIIDPHNNSNLILSMGHQDKTGYLVKLHLKGLLESLTLVNACE